jgi:hypothetical protein
VIAGPDGLTIVNPFRDHHVPWTAIQAVDTGEWVRVHYAPRREADQGSGPISSAASNAISCWALYISARTKRRITRISLASPAGFAGTGLASPAGLAGSAGPGASASRRRSAGFRRLSLPGMLEGAGKAPGYGASSRLPEEARYLASLPAAKAIAVRLDARAARERARARPADSAGLARARPAESAADAGGAVTVRWAWPPAAAVALPALVLVIVAVVL